MKFQTAAGNKLTYLYHYQRFQAERLAQTVSVDTIYLSNPSTFNDPWDCKPWFGNNPNDAANREKHIQWFDRIGRKHLPGLDENERQRRIAALRKDPAFLAKLIDECSREIGVAAAAQYRVYCLTTKPLSPLMWSHYAGSHQGICLEFRVRNEVMCTALKVDYRSEYPLLDLTDDDDYNNLIPLLAKSMVWEYEQEYRLVAQEEAFAVGKGTLLTKNNLLVLPSDALNSVIIGCTAPTAIVDQVHEIARKRSGPSVSVKQLRRVPNRYDLEMGAD